MRYELPVIWRAHGVTHTGRLALVLDRILLTSETRTISFDAGSVAELAIERAQEQRLRGLPVLALRLADGEVVRVASMGGAGSLHELAGRIGERQPAAAGT